MQKNIAIIGTGAYGTALANVLTDNGHNVIMYGIEESEINDINNLHLNTKFFKNLPINKKIIATNNLNKALINSQYVVMSVPTSVLGNVLKEILKIVNSNIIFINVAKGLEPENHYLLSEAYEKWLSKEKYSHQISAIYGPSIASEVLERKPTGIMAAANNLLLANQVKDLFNNNYFVVKSCDDIIGCEISAALKNIIAVATGMFHTLNNSDNALASLITMGLNEIILFGIKKGAHPNTFFNFAGIGDLILTATSPKSRNYSLGAEIAKYDNANVVLQKWKKTVEGVLTCQTIFHQAQKLNLNLPLISSLYEILYNDAKPSVIFKTLFERAVLI